MKTPESRLSNLILKRLTSNTQFFTGLATITIVALCIGCLLIALDVRGPTYSDHVKYHLPSILKIRGHWPSLDIREDTLSAIAPGYYYILAGISFLAGDSEISLRLANLVISSLLPALLFCYLIYCRFSARNSILFVLPVLLSPIFLKNSIWIMTDNAALLLAVLSLILILEDHASTFSAIRIGTVVSIATFVRQLNIWLALPSFINSLIDSGLDDRDGQNSPLRHWRLRASKAAMLFIWSLFLFLPLIVLLILFVSWGGLVPSRWSEASYSFSLCPIAYILSVFGVYGCAFVASISSKPIGYYLRLISIRYFLVIGLIASLINPTSYSYEFGRWGGLFWEIAKRMPEFEGRSAFFMVLAPVGSVVIGIMFYEMRNKKMIRESILWIFSVFAWSSTFLLNRQVFHRYFEVQAIVFLVIGLCILGKSGPSRVVIDKIWPVCLLVLGQISMIFLSLA